MDQWSHFLGIRDRLDESPGRPGCRTLRRARSPGLLLTIAIDSGCSASGRGIRPRSRQLGASPSPKGVPSSPREWLVELRRRPIDPAVPAPDQGIWNPRLAAPIRRPRWHTRRMRYIHLHDDGHQARFEDREISSRVPTSPRRHHPLTSRVRYRPVRSCSSDSQPAGTTPHTRRRPGNGCSCCRAEVRAQRVGRPAMGTRGRLPPRGHVSSWPLDDRSGGHSHGCCPLLTAPFLTTRFL